MFCVLFVFPTHHYHCALLTFTRRLEAQRRKERQEAHLYMTVDVSSCKYCIRVLWRDLLKLSVIESVYEAKLFFYELI